MRLCKILARLGMKKIKLTGGEPLVRKGITGLVQEIKEIEGIEQVTITTNGLLLEKLGENLIKAGVDAINISMDTLNPEHFKELTRGGNIEEVQRGIEKILSLSNIPLKINSVPNYINDNEILELVNIAKNKKIHVRFIELMPIGTGREYVYKDTEGVNQENRIHELLKNTFPNISYCNEKLGNGPSKYYNIEGFCGKIGFISAMSHKFCENCNRIRLTSEGFLKTCLQYEVGENLFTLLRNNAKDEEIIEKITNAISKKPLGHEFQDKNMQNEQIKGMSQIGG